MTKLRTAALLQDALDDDFAWRLKEIHDLRLAARSSDPSSQRTFVRAGVALLYAHWEGFVKTAAEAYVNFLACQALPYRSLRRCLAALGLRGHLLETAQSGKFATSTAALDFLLTELDKPARLPMREAVDTESNLSSTVFHNIAGWIGLATDRYETKYHFVDQSLLERRNRIAHGQFLDVDKAAFEQLVDETLILLRWFKTDIENALATKAYMQAAA